MAKKTKGKSAPAKGKKPAKKAAAAKRTKSSKAGKAVRRGLIGVEQGLRFARFQAARSSLK